MEKSRRDPLRGVLIHPASQIGLDDELIPYSNGAVDVDNDGVLVELRRISRSLTQIAGTLARLEGICMVIGARTSSLRNVQTVSPVKWGQKQDKARQLLLDLLAKNPKGVDVKRIRTEAAIRGISMQTMKMVKKSMGLKAEKHGTSWLWKWPDQQ